MPILSELEFATRMATAVFQTNLVVYRSTTRARDSEGGLVYPLNNVLAPGTTIYLYDLIF